MQLHHIKRPSRLLRKAQRVGRGQSSGRGKQSGRGGKGQTARAGAKIRPEWRDIIKKLPKRRGYGKNRGRTVVDRPEAFLVSLSRLERAFESGETVSPHTLAAKGILGRRPQPVKIVGGGVITKKLSLLRIAVSDQARKALEKAGGSIA